MSDQDILDRLSECSCCKAVGVDPWDDLCPFCADDLRDQIERNRIAVRDREGS